MEVLVTLNASLVTSTTGLMAQSTALSNISSNLANASTTAYKETSTNFSDLVTTYADGTNYATGLDGVIASVNYNNDVQGDISSTDTTTDLAISGNGYFVVTTAVLNADGTISFSNEEYYTRCGDFSLDENGYMVNSEGYYLMGWTVDPSTGTVEETLTPIQISSDQKSNPIATTEISYSANLPAGVDTTGTSTVTVYDSIGESHDVTYTWTLTDADTNTWTLSIGAEGGSSGGDYAASIVVSFDEYGEIDTVDVGDYYDVSGTTISFDLTYTDAATQTIACDLSNVTQYSASSINVASFTADGVSYGSYDSLGVDSNGYISISYSNGQIETYYEIPVATFMSSDYLAPVSGNAYQATTSSGDPTYSAAGTNGAGTVCSSSLESSNVDIASQFTDMVATQQVYSANARIISTVDEMMQTLVNL